MTTNERLDRLVNELSDQDADATLVITQRRREDPMMRALAAAPPDDEPADSDEDVGAAQALDAYRHAEGVSLKELRSELGLD